MKDLVWVGQVGDLIIARMRGEPTESMLVSCQEQVLNLVASGGKARVLYDTLEMQAPPVDIPWAQRALGEKLGAVQLRRAIVVPDSKLAYLARIAFGEGDYRVFYNDMIAAVKWLSHDPAQ